MKFIEDKMTHFTFRISSITQTYDVKSYIHRKLCIVLDMVWMHKPQKTTAQICSKDAAYKKTLPHNGS